VQVSINEQYLSVSFVRMNSLHWKNRPLTMAVLERRERASGSTFRNFDPAT
jgi:hypothetical protein